MKRNFSRLVGLALIAAMLAACAPQATPSPTSQPTATSSSAGQTPTAAETPQAAQTTAPVTVAFWSAPNPPQTAFWQGMAQAYMAEHPGVTVNVSPMAESPSSEATILTAIAGGTAPVASENIFIGFGQQLASSNALVPLDTMPGWQELVQSRHMEQSIQGWKFPDGHTYILPIYSNAMLMGWRIDILKQLGFDKPPRTYSEVYAVGQKLKAQFPDKTVWARAALSQNTWWERWFDFFMLYYAASDGKSLISGSTITADDKAAVDTLNFFGQLSKQGFLLTQQVTDPFETGVEVMDSIGPWTFATWKEKYPELKLDVNYALTPPPVPDDYPADQPVKTFADAKGLVLYRQATPEATAAMWDFIKWVFSDPQHDLTWLQKTTLPPARDDLGTNAAFQSFFNDNPQLRAYAAELPYAVPPMAAAKYTDIQTALGDQAVVPVVTQGQDPTQAWDNFKKSLAGLIQ